MQCDNLRPIYSPGSLIGIFGTYCAWEPSMPLGAKLNIVDDYFTSGLTLANIPLRDTASEYNTEWFLVGFAHVAGRNGNVRRAAQAFQYGYNDEVDSARPGVTPPLGAHSETGIRPRLLLLRHHAPRRRKPGRHLEPSRGG